MAGALLYVGARLVVGIATGVLDAPYRGYGEPSTRVVVARGSTADEIARQFADAGVIRDARALRWWLRVTGRAGQVQAGEYRFTEPHSVRQVADVLVEGRVALRPVTIPEGATRWQVAEALAAADFGSHEEVLAATAMPTPIADLDPEAVNLEGYLFPDTYLAPRNASAKDLVDMMVERFRQVWTASRQAQAARRDLSVRSLVTLASLVEAETKLAHERPLVAAVFANRLERRMLLQCDPTLLYALRMEGRTDRNIRRSDFANESPYNTYRFAGLPPGPIANPGEASLDAALSPAVVDYLYFVARNDGSHAFSRTLREHNAKVIEYQRRSRKVAR